MATMQKAPVSTRAPKKPGKKESFLESLIPTPENVEGLGSEIGELGEKIGGYAPTPKHVEQTVKEAEEIGQKAKSAVEGPIAWTEALAKVLKNLLDVKFWIRVGLILLGIVALVFGLYMFGKALR